MRPSVKQTSLVLGLLLAAALGCGGEAPTVIKPDNPAPPPGIEALRSSAEEITVPAGSEP